MEWIIREVNGNAIIEPTEDKECHFCKTKLILHDFYPQKSYNFFHADVHLKCPECSWWVTFGVPISEADFNKLSRSKYAKKPLTHELLELGLKQVEKRLKTFGYW